MTDLDRINARLDTIETMLRQLLNQQSSDASPIVPVYTPTIDDEIAAVRAQGGSLAEYFKAKSKMKRERRKKC